MNFAKFLRTLIFIEHFWWLLLYCYALPSQFFNYNAWNRCSCAEVYLEPFPSIYDWDFLRDIRYQREGDRFSRKLLVRKCTDFPSVLLSFLEDALKSRPTVIWSWYKVSNVGQFKTHLAVHGGGQIWENDWFGKACLTLSSQYCESRTSRITLFLGLKFDIRFLRILKLL